MKKQIVSLLLLTALVYGGVALGQLVQLFIQNDSSWGFDVVYTIDGKQHSVHVLAGEPLKAIGSLSAITAISIKGFVTSSLDYVLKQIKEDYLKYRGRDPIIIIQASTLGWQKKIRWENVTSGKKVESFGIATGTSEITTGILGDIFEGRMGQDVQQKAAAIYNADYTAAKSNGYVNLADHLKKEFSEYGKIYEKQQTSSLSMTKDEAIAIVNRLYKQLENYRKKELVD